MKRIIRSICCLSAAFGGFFGVSSASAAEKVTARSYEGHDDLIAQWDGILFFQDGSRKLGMRNASGENYIQYTDDDHYHVSGQTATYALTFARTTDAGYENGVACEGWSTHDGWGPSSALMLCYNKGTYPAISVVHDHASAEWALDAICGVCYTLLKCW